MLDWIFEGIAEWIGGIVSSMMDAVSGIFLGALGADMTTMEEYFPFGQKRLFGVAVHRMGALVSHYRMAAVPQFGRSSF